MSRYRRARTQGGTYFFTVVTYQRRKIFMDESSIGKLRQVIKEVRQLHPFAIDAWVLLPDHMHCVWTLPEGDSNYSKRMGMIKARFTSRMKLKQREPECVSGSRARHREGVIWQRRFWEHPGEAWVGEPGLRVAVFNISSLCGKGRISGGLGGCGDGNIRRVR